jgi:hypothetical protein
MYQADSGDITPFHVVMTNEKNHFMAAVDTNDQELINKAMGAYEDKTWELQRVAFDDKSKECGVFRVFNVPALGDCLFHAVWLHLYIHEHPFCPTTSSPPISAQTPNTPLVPQDCEALWKKINKEVSAINDSAVGHTHP